MIDSLNMVFQKYNIKREQLGFKPKYVNVEIVWDLISVMREYFKTAMARIARILPAFGIGGIINKDLRTRAKAYY